MKLVEDSIWLERISEIKNLRETENWTYEKFATQYGVSRERIRQIFKKFLPDLMGNVVRNPEAKVSRFLSRIEKEEEETGHWWLLIKPNGTERVIATSYIRQVWELVKGELPPPKLFNTCGYNSCVNPAHWQAEANWSAFDDRWLPLINQLTTQIAEKTPREVMAKQYNISAARLSQVLKELRDRGLLTV